MTAMKQPGNQLAIDIDTATLKNGRTPFFELAE